MKYRLQAIALTVLSACCVVGADAGWKRLQASNFEVVTDASSEGATRILRQLQRLRNAFEIETGLTELSQAAVRVYLFRKQFDFSSFRDEPYISGFYQPARDRDMIVIHDTGDDLLRTAFHEYTHLVLHRSGVKLPKWLDEGLAEFFSTAVVDGRKMTTGRPVASHVAFLKTAKLVPIDKLEALPPEQHALFYGESWALVHMLASERPYSERFPEWLLLVTTGVKPGDATWQIYGKKDLLPELQSYVTSGVFSTRTLQTASDQDFGLESASEVSDPESLLIRLLIEVARLDQAEERLRKLPDALPLKAELAMARGNNEEALLLYERALARGKGNADAYYDYASLLYETHALVNDVVTLLGRAIELQPDLFPARYLLGTVLVKEGKFADAIPHLEAALTLQPHQKAVKQELDLARSKGVVERTPTSSIRFPEKPQIDTSEMVGMLVQLDCLGDLARLVVQAEGRRQFLLISDPKAVTLKGSGVANLEFGCGPLTPRKVRVSYKPGEDHVRGTAGEVTVIEFQQ